MASTTRSMRRLAAPFSQLNLADPLTQCLAPGLTRSMATIVDRSPAQAESSSVSSTPSSKPASKFKTAVRKEIESPVLTTLYQWPTIEPVRFAQYSSQHLDLPLRRDILHRAVIYEGDATRQGSASTKWRDDVHGSGRKIHPQKGTGQARAGDKKSPIRRGGGVAFGPHPRDFATSLNRKIYDKAWRTALSHRWRKGELVVIDNTISMPWDATPHFLNNLFQSQQWGKGFGRSTLVTLNPRQKLNETMKEMGEHGLVRDVYDVDVKDLLETGRIVIEKFALDALIGAHMSDIGPKTSLDMSHRTQQGLFKQYRTAMLEAESAEGDMDYEEVTEEARPTL